ncbi:MAG TPA: YcaO-like family protein [Archangium sp.]|nr:YcaO-like family protein [Archangium sp.]
MTARESRRLRLDRLLGLWNHLVDPKVGVINEVYELPIDEDDPNFFHYLSTSCNTARFTPLQNFRNNGGVSTDRPTGIAKAMGEAVERYCSAIFDYGDLLLAPYRELRQKATAPDAFALYLPEQHRRGNLPWAPFTEDSRVCWARGRSLCSGDEVLVPAAMVYVPYHYVTSRGDAAIVQPISTGLASGCSFEEAALSGLCEVVERDAFTLTWQARLSAPRIDPLTLPPSGQDLLRRYAEVGLEVQLLDITLDIRFPTVMSIALGESPASPAVAVAAATDPSAEVALIKSLEELAHTRKFAKQLMEYTPPVPVELEQGHPHVEDQKHHLRLYCPQESKPFISFAWASPELRRFPDVVDHGHLRPDEALKALVREVGQAGMDVIVCDLTTPDIAALGLHVVRVVVPGMNPLFMGHKNRALGGRRLYEVPQRFGHRGIERGHPDNPYPHPFP